jgi:hypothetical protein
VAQTGLVVDGAAFGDYLKAKVRGQTAEQPQAVGIEHFITSGK